ncbi:hypothetical protein ACGFNQ_13130 [Streptomyces asoensis]|uniref:hypothetical protein n=1 Tax=Streptomyces asoensis TaxID=249586 RepID=UPI0037126FBF
MPTAWADVTLLTGPELRARPASPAPGPDPQHRATVPGHRVGPPCRGSAVGFVALARRVGPPFTGSHIVRS